MEVTSQKNSRYFLTALLLVFLILTIFLLSGFAAPIVLGLILSGLAYRGHKKILSRLGGRKNLAALLVLFIILAIIILPLVLIATSLFGQAANLVAVTQGK